MTHPYQNVVKQLKLSDSNLIRKQICYYIMWKLGQKSHENKQVLRKDEKKKLISRRKKTMKEIAKILIGVVFRLVTLLFYFSAFFNSFILII